MIVCGHCNSEIGDRLPPQTVIVCGGGGHGVVGLFPDSIVGTESSGVRITVDDSVVHECGDPDMEQRTRRRGPVHWVEP